MGLSHRVLPGWLERNWLFRKLFLLRKLFLTRRRFSHHGQFAEDVCIARFFPKKMKGFFVDVGCFHPVKYSNTWVLYRRGWRGINVDADSIKIEGFQMLRPGDVNVASAVGPVRGEVEFYRSGFYSLTNTLDPTFAAEWGCEARSTVTCRTLTEIVDATRYRGRRIDLLSVDTEGHDLQVLQSLDFDRYRPALIAVETHARTLEELHATPLYAHVAALGYSLAGWVGLTLLWVDRARVPAEGPPELSAGA
jgi:FkbM family methyltransferase